MGAMGSFPGGGGAKINGVVKRYAVMAGENISAGDFVRYVNDLTTNTSDTRLSTTVQTGVFLSAVPISDDKVFIAHSYSSNKYLYGIVITISGSTITAGPDTQLYFGTGSGSSISAILMPDGRVFIVHSAGSNQVLEGTVVTISGTTITVVTTASIGGQYTGNQVKAILLPNGTVFVAHTLTFNYLLAGLIVTISGSTITAGPDTQLSNSGAYAGMVISPVLLPNGNVFIAHSGNSGSYNLFGVIANISGTSVSAGTDTQLSTTAQSGNAISATTLLDNRVYIVHSHSTSYYIYSMIVSVSGNVITVGTTMSIVSGSVSVSASISTSLMPGSRVLVLYRRGVSGDEQLYGVLSLVGNNHAGDTKLSSVACPAGAISSVVFPSGKIFVAHASSNSYYLHGMLPVVGGAKRTDVPTTDLAGVAENSVINGYIDVYVPGRK